MQLLNSKILSNDKNTRYSNKKAQDTQYLVLFVCCSFFVQQRWWSSRDLCLWRHAPTKGTPCPLVCATLYLFPFLIERKPIASRQSPPPASPDCFSFPSKAKRRRFTASFAFGGAVGTCTRVLTILGGLSTRLVCLLSLFRSFGKQTLRNVRRSNTTAAPRRRRYGRSPS